MENKYFDKVEKELGDLWDLKAMCTGCDYGTSNCNELRIRKFIRQAFKEYKEELKKKNKKISQLLFDLTQSHDCAKDTACEFEDRAFNTLNKVYELLDENQYEEDRKNINRKL